MAAPTPEGFRDVQLAFAGHIRDPENKPAPEDVEDRRMAVYRELFFNNIQSLLATNFPVLHKLYGEKGWERLIRDFYAVHHCKTPLFPEVAKEFLRYLQDERKPREADPGFLLELAHYEWVELALSLDERELDDIPADPAGDLLEGAPVLSPLAWPLSYAWPVHLIGPDFQPAEPPVEATHILVYRNHADQIRFMQLNGVSRFLLARLQEDPPESGLLLLNEIAQTIGHPEPEKVVAAGAELLEEFRQKDILLGTRPI